MNSYPFLKKYIYLASFSLLVLSAELSAATFSATQQEGKSLAKAFEGHFGQKYLIQKPSLGTEKGEYRSIVKLIQQNNFLQAQKKIDALIKKIPENPNHYNLRALLEVAKKRPDIAQQSFHKAIELDSQYFPAYLGLAQIHFNKGEMAKAKQYAEKTIAINEKAVQPYLLLADIAMKNNHEKEVERLLTTALKKNHGDITQELKISNYLAQFYLYKKQAEKILSLADSMNQRFPKNREVLSFLAKVQLFNTKMDAAEETLQELINLGYADVNQSLELARLLSKRNASEQSVLEILNRALRLKPDNLQLLIYKTAYLTEKGHFQEALESAEKVEKTYPEFAAGKILKADIYLAQNNLSKGLEYTQQAYKIQAIEKQMFIIAQILSSQGKRVEAIAFLNKELQKTPKNYGIHKVLANLYQHQKDYNQAVKHYKIILIEMPENIQALNDLAWIYSQQNNPQAEELAKQAYTLSSAAPIIADTYGYILIKNGKISEGLPILKNASISAPKIDIIKLHLAQAYVANREIDKAILQLKPLVTKEGFVQQKAAIELLDQLKPQ